MNGIYRFAEKNVEIRSLYPNVHALCRGYEAEGPADFTVEIAPADIEAERAGEDQAEGRTPGAWSGGYLEELAVYRKIAEQMPQYGTVLFHGSAVAVDGQAYLFAARSGTGKSTHAAMWRQLLGSRAVMVNDDKPLVHIGPDRALVYGTPWNGKHRLGSNISCPLRAVCTLERAEENSIREMGRQEALPLLLRQIYRPADPAALAHTLRLTDALMASVRLYRLGCNMDLSAAELSYNFMKG